MKNKYITLLKHQIKNGDWTGYVTYYPHKRAYRSLQNLNMQLVWSEVKELSLYVHIPFCDKKCTYCNLFSTVLKQQEKQIIYASYVQKVLEEIDYYKSFIPSSTKIMSLYFGGGTPSVLEIEYINSIITKLKQTFPNWDENIEVCMECSPDQLTYDYLKNLKRIGIDRISVGVQSMVEKELKTINRSTDTQKITDIRTFAKDLNLNINYDLIYGLPHQTKQSFFYSLNKIISLSPESICTYPLAVRPHTKINKTPSQLIFTNKQKYAVFKQIRKKLEQNGYTCETIVRFTKSQNSTCQMEKYEYEGVPTLGFGAGARSYAPSVNYAVTYKVQDKLVKTIIEEYLNTLPKNRSFDGYVYNEQDHKIKYIMLNLIGEDANENVFKQKFNTTIKATFAHQIFTLTKLKLIAFNKKTRIYKLTKKGMQYCDLVANIFVSDEVQHLYNSYKAE
jgi:oxygen-independent coproporphyrinogen-3 oxidase